MAHVNPNVVQQAYRFRDDDGSETAATWLAALNTSITQAADTAFRVRILIEETAGGNANNYNYSPVQFRVNGGTWTNCTTSTAVQYIASAHVTNGEATTQQIGSGSFVAGTIDSDGSAGNISLSSQETEMEYVLRLSGVSDGDTIELKTTNAGADLNGYTQTPTLTASVDDSVTIEANAGTATVSGFTASVVASDHQTVAANAGSITTTGVTPTVTASDNKVVAANVGAVSTSGFTPTVTTTSNQLVIANAGSVSLTGFTASVSVSNHQVIAANVGSINAAGFTPVVSTAANTVVEAQTGSITLTGFTATATTTNHQTVEANLGTVGAVGFTPTVSVSSHQIVSALAGSVALTGFQATVLTGGPYVVEAPFGEIVLTAGTVKIRLSMSGRRKIVGVAVPIPLKFYPR